MKIPKCVYMRDTDERVFSEISPLVSKTVRII